MTNISRELARLAVETIDLVLRATVFVLALTLVPLAWLILVAIGLPWVAIDRWRGRRTAVRAGSSPDHHPDPLPGYDVITDPDEALAAVRKSLKTRKPVAVYLRGDREPAHWWGGSQFHATEEGARFSLELRAATRAMRAPEVTWCAKAGEN